MPTPDFILLSLTQIANQGRILAIGWHVLIALVLVAAVFGWRPSRRMAGILLSMPLLSVSVWAWKFGNPFNGMVLLLVPVILGWLALRLEPGLVHSARGWPVWAGALVLAFGWAYPHFLENGSWSQYLYAAPVGLIPCPTLSVVIGFALLGGGLNARAWSMTLSGLGLFYGLFGALRLGVWLDLGLVAGSLALLVQALSIKDTTKA